VIVSITSFILFSFVCILKRKDWNNSLLVHEFSYVFFFKGSSIMSSYIYIYQSFHFVLDYTVSAGFHQNGTFDCWGFVAGKQSFFRWLFHVAKYYHFLHNNSVSWFHENVDISIKLCMQQRLRLSNAVPYYLSFKNICVRSKGSVDATQAEGMADILNEEVRKGTRSCSAFKKIPNGAL